MEQYGCSLASSDRRNTYTIPQAGSDVNGEYVKSQQQRVWSSENIPNSITLTADNYTVSQLFDLVKNSDKNFNPRKSSVVVNEDGTPKVVYHGTRANFNTFKLQPDTEFGRALGDGFYFTENYNRAFRYANGITGKDHGGNIMSVYLDIKNPFYITEQNAGNYGAELQEGLYNNQYDGVIDTRNGTYLVFDSAQIKSATDNTGMFSKYNPDIRYKVADAPAEQAQNTKAAESVKKIEQEFAEKSREINDEKLSEKSLADVFFEMSPEERKKHFGNLREGYELDTDLPEKLAEMPPEWSDEMKMTALGWRKIYEQRKG